MGVYRYKNKDAEKTAPPKQKQSVGDEAVTPTDEVADEFVSGGRVPSRGPASLPAGSRVTSKIRGGE